MQNKQLIDYINNRFNQGVDKQTINAELLGAGWAPSEIDGALLTIFGISRKSVTKFTKGKLVLSLISALLILISLSFVVYRYILRPEFELVALSVPAEDVALYERVEIRVEIRNAGFLDGEYNAEFRLDGEFKESKTINIGGRDTGELQFDLVFTEDNEWGAHDVEIGGTTERLTVNEGLRPTINVGDVIISESTSGSITSKVTESVVGDSAINGKDCWLIEATFDPPLADIFSEGELCADKTTFFPLKSTLSGEGAEVVKYSTYEFLGAEPIFPLRVGQVIVVRENDDITTTFFGPQINERDSNIKKYQVEDIEDISTPTGNIKAFRINILDEKDVLIATIWEAPKVKLNIIKSINYETGDTQNLKSFDFPN